MAAVSNPTDSLFCKPDFSNLGKDYGLSLQFDLCAADFVNQKIEKDILTESISKTRWKFHFHDGFACVSKPAIHNDQYCWNFDKSFLTTLSHKSNVDAITLGDNYTYVLLVNWRDIDRSMDMTKSSSFSNPHNLSMQNHSVQQSMGKPHKKSHHWRIPLRARIQHSDDRKSFGKGIKSAHSKSEYLYSQFVDWVTLKSSTSSRASSIGLRTNHYNEKYHTAPSRSNASVASASTSTPVSPSTAQPTSNVASTPTPSGTVTINKKATFIGCDYKLENGNLYSEWQLLVITGRKQAYDGPDSSFWIGTKTKSIRKIGGIRGSVPGSCLYSIGSDANAKENKYCAGKVSRVLIFDGVLSKPDIQKLYAATFRIDDDQIRSLLPKSAKWHSISKRKRHQRSQHHDRNRNGNDRINRKAQRSKDIDHSLLSTPNTSANGKRSLLERKRGKSTSPPSISATASSTNSSMAMSPVTSPPSTEKGSRHSGMHSPVMVNHASGHSDDLSTNSRHTASASSIQMDSMDENLRKQIAKQAVIHENDRESSTSSSDGGPDTADHDLREEEEEEEEEEEIDSKEREDIGDGNNGLKSNGNEVIVEAEPGAVREAVTSSSSSSSSSASSVKRADRTPAEAVEMDVDHCPHHEKLLPQLEADILEQQKMMEEQRERDKLNEGNVLNKFLKSMRNLTNGTLLEDEEDDDHVVKVIPIDHSRRPTSVRQVASDNDHKERDRMNEENGDIEHIESDSHCEPGASPQMKQKGNGGGVQFGSDDTSPLSDKQSPSKSSRNDRKARKGTLRMPPLRDSVQHVVLYETSHRFFLVGSNLECTKYWILKIDRKGAPNSNASSTGNTPIKSKDKNRRMTSPSTVHNDVTSKHLRRGRDGRDGRDNRGFHDQSSLSEKHVRRGQQSSHSRLSSREASESVGAVTHPRQFSLHEHQANARRRPGLHIVEDRTVYNRDEITTILSMIGAGNKSNGGLTQCISGYGIVGFIRFLEGYYIVLITERSKVGMIGQHVIYKIEKTAMIPVTPSQLDNASSKRLRSDETRYKNLFAVIDLNKEFYFSYTYDLSRTLQWNMCNHFRRKPNHIFVWNEFLLKPLRLATQSNTWMLPIIHGYYETKICSIYGREVTLTLISRRSKQFAGTRYLKRGINDLGHSANDIETEQVLHDRVGGDHFEGQFSSHVQMRASIPLFWVQDSNPMVPKPDIYIQKVDPSCASIRKHFQSVFKRYGAPVLALNLIKHQESHAREVIVGKEFGRAMSFINSFLPKDYKISFIAWDFKDCQRHKARSVVDELTKFAEWGIQRTGFFHSNPKPEALSAFARRTHDISPDDPDVQPVRYEDSDEFKSAEGDSPNFHDSKEQRNKEPTVFSIPESVLLRAFCRRKKSKRRIYDLGCFQKGVMRANCIDSLDRTNVAQFIIGKCALGYQLYAMGIRAAPWLDRESDFIRVLLQMYERMGDALALQYGGSQMHRQMKKDHAEARSVAPQLYKQKDPGTRPREMFVSFVRHYQNNFQDNVKQDAMNLFLGTFRPDPSVGSYRLWELGSDYYLHNRLVTIYKKVPKTLSEQDQWWISSVLSFNKSFIHCYKHSMFQRQILPPTKCVRLMSNVCKSIEAAIVKAQSPLRSTTMVILKYHSNLGITNSYLQLQRSPEERRDDDSFFELAFNASSLTLFDEEMKLQCNKIETISRNPYGHTVHALFYENPSDANAQYEKSKISRITPFLRSKKNKIGYNNDKTGSAEGGQQDDDTKGVGGNGTSGGSLVPYGGAEKLDLTPYVANVSSSLMHKFESWTYHSDAEDAREEGATGGTVTVTGGAPDDEDTSKSRLAVSSPPPRSVIDYDEQSLSGSLTGGVPSKPPSVSSMAPMTALHSSNVSSTGNVLYQDEDMHSQHLPSMTLSAIMQQSYTAYERPVFGKKASKPILEETKSVDDDAVVIGGANNGVNGFMPPRTSVAPQDVPSRLRHSRQVSDLGMRSMPMQFQLVMDRPRNNGIDFDHAGFPSLDKRDALSEKDNEPKIPEMNGKTKKSMEDNRRRWRGFGFFNIFGSGPWSANQGPMERDKSDANIERGNGNGLGQNGAPNAMSFGSSGYHQRYGEPDSYYSDELEEQQELALPSNIFMDKTDFTRFLNRNYGRYELNDYVLSTHECMEEKTQKDFVSNVNRISVCGQLNDYQIPKSAKAINECIRSRFKETDVGLSEQDFSAFAKLHCSYLNLDQEIAFIEQDNMKRQGYAFYSHIAHNLCHQSLNPKQLDDSHISGSDGARG